MVGAGVPFMAAHVSGGRLPCEGQAHRQQLQEFDYFVVIDFEATCEKNARIFPQEIIEFPSVLVDGATGHLESAFRRGDTVGIDTWVSCHGKCAMRRDWHLCDLTTCQTILRATSKSVMVHRLTRRKMTS